MHQNTLHVISEQVQLVTIAGIFFQNFTKIDILEVFHSVITKIEVNIRCRVVQFPDYPASRTAFRPRSWWSVGIRRSVGVGVAMLSVSSACYNNKVSSTTNANARLGVAVIAGGRQGRHIAIFLVLLLFIIGIIELVFSPTPTPRASVT